MVTRLLRMNVLQTYGLLVPEMVALFFGVTMAITLLQRRIGPERLERWLSGPPVAAALKGVAIGFVTPFCTYSAIPILVMLRQAGVRPAGYVAFIVAAPVLDPILLGALLLIVGVKAATTYVVVAFTAALTVALLSERADIDRYMKPVPLMAGSSTKNGGAPSVSCAVVAPWDGLRNEMPRAVSSSVTLLRSMVKLMLVGIVIGAAISVLVSPEMASSIASSDNPLAIPLGALVGVPLYISNALFVPLGHAMTDAGVGSAAIVAFTIAGTGANLPEFVMLTRLAKIPLVAGLGMYVFATAVVGGVVTALVT